MDFDLAIIGAGPTGTAAAMAARRAGLSVALVDKAKFPRAKLCGGLITGRCAQHLQDVFGQQINETLFETRRRFAFYMHGEQLADMTDGPEAYLTMRWDFDHQLFDHAIAAGAVDFSGCRIETLDLEAGKISLSNGQEITFACLIGADGVQSIVAKALFGASFDKTKIGFALEIEDVATKVDETTPIRVDFAAANWGYGWSFPKRKSTTIGVGGLQTENPDMKARLSAYLDVLDGDHDIKVKGHFLPFGGFRDKPGRSNVLLAGDAAGFVDPITGEGIGYAIQSGALAGQAVADAVRAGAPESALARYRPATRPIRVALRCAQALRPVIFARRLTPFFASTFRASRHLKHDYMRLLAGETEYPQLLRRTMARLPSAGLRFLWRRATGTRRAGTDRQTG
jgi:geranylgeranyl reductase family protein